jgi:hypothetical protein
MEVALTSLLFSPAMRRVVLFAQTPAASPRRNRGVHRNTDGLSAVFYRTSTFNNAMTKMSA